MLIYKGKCKITCTVLLAGIYTREHKTSAYVADLFFGGIFGGIFNFDRHRTSDLGTDGVLDDIESKVLYDMRGMVDIRFFVLVLNSKSDFTYLAL